MVDIGKNVGNEVKPIKKPSIEIKPISSQPIPIIKKKVPKIEGLIMPLQLVDTLLRAINHYLNTLKAEEKRLDHKTNQGRIRIYRLEALQAQRILEANLTTLNPEEE